MALSSVLFDKSLNRTSTAAMDPNNLPNKPSENNCGPIQRDVDFYCETITFQVEDTLFCVPRWGFEDPECFFAGMFDLPGPGPDGKQVQGISDEFPIVLEGERKSGFKAFLKALYPPPYRSNPGHMKPGYGLVSDQREALTFDEWDAILYFSTKWSFAQVRSKAIEEISVLFPSNITRWDKIALAKKYRVRRWLLQVYRDLAMQEESHDVALLMKEMGLTEAVKLLQIRENKYSALKPCGKSVRCRKKNWEIETENRVILETFASEFEWMKDDE